VAVAAVTALLAATLVDAVGSAQPTQRSVAGPIVARAPLPRPLARVGVAPACHCRSRIFSAGASPEVRARAVREGAPFGRQPRRGLFHPVVVARAHGARRVATRVPAHAAVDVGVASPGAARGHPTAVRRVARGIVAELARLACPARRTEAVGQRPRPCRHAMATAAP